jgi:L-threonylcarbamoyladenylate synthase
MISTHFVQGKSDLELAAKNLISGNLVAFPTETVYGLGADASNRSAVARVYKVKSRPNSRPLIVHISSIAKLSLWAKEIPSYAFEIAAAYWPGPITLILERTKLAANFITSGQSTIAVRVPNHPVALGVLAAFERQGGLGVAAPSANRYGKVSPTDAQAVISELGKHLSSIDLVLDGGECSIGIESTILDCTSKLPKILRPGAITQSMIESISPLQKSNETYSSLVRFSGQVDNHYSPNAKVFLKGEPNKGDGFIALASIDSPKGVIRLAQPKDEVEFARVLYQSLRLADIKKIKNVFIVPPPLEGVGVAIYDRIKKAEFNF